MRFLIRMVVVNIFLLPLMAITPAIYLTMPFYVLATDSRRDLAVLARVMLLIGPLSCAFYMLVFCHWPTVRKAHREGRLHEWRDDAGGYGSTIPKAFVFMCIGLFGSIISEIAFYNLFCLPTGLAKWCAAVWFAILPLVSFAPLILLWIIRRMRGRKRHDFISRMKNDDALQEQLRSASLYARSLRTNNTGAEWEKKQ